MRQGDKPFNDMRRSLSINSTCDIGENRPQGNAALPFLKWTSGQVLLTCAVRSGQIHTKGPNIITSLNVDSLIGSKLPRIESTCLTTIIGLEIY